MSRKEQKQQSKKKKREEVAKNRVLARREQLRKKAKFEREQEKMMKKNDKLQPFVKENHPSNLVLPTQDDEATVKNRLNKHLQEINKIKEEIDQEKKTRDEINQKLESQGLYDIKDKMEHLDSQAKKKRGKMQGSALVEFNPNL